MHLQFTHRALEKLVLAYCVRIAQLKTKGL